MTTKTVEVPSISCGHCVATIKRELADLPGVGAVEGDPATQRVTVSWDESRVSWDAIRALLDEIGYAPAE